MTIAYDSWLKLINKFICNTTITQLTHNTVVGIINHQPFLYVQHLWFEGDHY